MREYLLAKGFSTSAVDHTFNELLEMGLLDDVAYAHALVSHAQLSRRGRKHVYGKLRARGIDRALAEEVVRNAFDSDKEIEDATYFIAKKVSKGSPEERREAVKKAAMMLVRRGFSLSSVNRALDSFRE